MLPPARESLERVEDQSEQVAIRSPEVPSQVLRRRAVSERMSESKPSPTANVDAYIEAAPEAARPMLVRLRSIIRAAAPEATETISYGVPSFKLRGSLVSFGAAS